MSTATDQQHAIDIHRDRGAWHQRKAAQWMTNELAADVATRAEYAWHNADEARYHYQQAARLERWRELIAAEQARADSYQPRKVDA